MNTVVLVLSFPALLRGKRQVDRGPQLPTLVLVEERLLSFGEGELDGIAWDGSPARVLYPGGSNALRIDVQLASADL